MKKTIKLLTLAFVLFATACNNDDEMDMFNSLWRNVTQNEARIDALEKWCAQANTNISSLQTIVNVFESNDAITSITPVMEGGVEIGYTITFSNHDPITIYHGKDGKDGQNGANGQNGTSPIVGVAKYTDGVYYWTLNGEWLLDENGNKLRVSGEDGKDGKDGEDGVDGADGKDGENGKDGADGQNGTNGQNGITPQLKIENDYWWISYDNGNTWTQLGKAKGEDGQDGADGQDGQAGEKGDKGDTGDSMFQSVTQDADNVYFTLADGSIITIRKCDHSQVYKMIYNSNGGSGSMKEDSVYYDYSYTIKKSTFTRSGYKFETWNTSPDGSGISYPPFENIAVIKNTTLYAQWEKITTGTENGYAWVDLGLRSGLKWATCNVGASSPEGYGNYYTWGGTVDYNISSSYGSGSESSILILSKDAAAVNMGGNWRMPIYAELKELINECSWIWTTQNGINGYRVTGMNGNSIFLPAAGSLPTGLSSGVGVEGNYRCSELNSSRNPQYLEFNSNKVNLMSITGMYIGSTTPFNAGYSVRGVCP